MGETIRSEALAVLRVHTVCEADRVTLTCGTLDRTIYDEVNEVLTRLGGRWNGSKRAHLFPYDPHPLLAAACCSGILPAKNPHAFFPTPDALLDTIFTHYYLPRWWQIERDFRVLEPSAGVGGIADRLHGEMRLSEPCPTYYEPARENYVTLDLVEIDPFHVEILRAKGYTPHEADFLTFAPSVPYDLIVMNPPFSVEDDKQAGLTHTTRAWEMLAPGGTLIAILPGTWQTAGDARSKAFHSLVSHQHGLVIENAADAFKESGANVRTVTVILDKAL